MHLNRINFEDMSERFFKVLEPAKRYGAGVVVGTIDEDEPCALPRKSSDCRRYRTAVEYGILSQVIFTIFSRCRSQQELKRIGKEMAPKQLKPSARSVYTCRA